MNQVMLFHLLKRFLGILDQNLKEKNFFDCKTSKEVLYIFTGLHFLIIQEMFSNELQKLETIK